ncbi:MAG TPA: hypothetical protein VFN35_30625 [Ktedonobacteraceae bacterium]|nr:hypothetical protein [Ktedonobacteraceae bacterium]
MQTDERNVVRASSAVYCPITPQGSHLPLREALSLLGYHLRLLNWWLFLLMALGFLASGGLLWLQLHASDPHRLSNATSLSLFVIEPGAALLAGLLAGSLLVGDDSLEIVMATRSGLHQVLLWRALLTFLALLLCSFAYLAWSLGNGIGYARQQSALFLLLVWLAPVLTMGALGLLGSLVTRNASLSGVLAAIPLAGALFLQARLQPVQAVHPFILPYTFWGEQDAPDWWLNRLILLLFALGFALCCWLWLRQEERLLSNGQ